jgi:hypothetical protein
MKKTIMIVGTDEPFAWSKVINAHFPNWYIIPYNGMTGRIADMIIDVCDRDLNEFEEMRVKQCRRNKITEMETIKTDGKIKVSPTHIMDGGKMRPRCKDPICKCCQHCEYGYYIWPMGYETEIDYDRNNYEVICIIGAEKDLPYDFEAEEFEEWYKTTLTYDSPSDDETFKEVF